MPTPEEMRELARRLEELVRGMNGALLKLAAIDPDGVVDVFVETQAKLLFFDAAAKERLGTAIEDARVKSLARDDFLMSCLLTSAVALKQFKNEPRRVGGTVARLVNRLQGAATAPPSLWAFTLASLYGVLGSRAYARLQAAREKKTIKIGTKL